MNNDDQIPSAMGTISEAIRADTAQGSYAHTWWCNLVMPVIDANGSRKVAETAASTFMFNAFGFKVPNDWKSGE